MPTAPHEFLASLAEPAALTALFDTLPGVYFYAKDRHSRFTLANAAQLRLLGAATLDEVVGKRDEDFFAREIADLYLAEDQAVFAGETILNKRWMVPGSEGRMRWYLSSKLPLRDKHGAVVGLCGLLRDLHEASGEVEAYGSLAPVIAHINTHYKEPVLAEDLAALVGVSTSQFNRRFKAFTGLSPMAYLLTVRVNAAKAQLLHTDRSVTEIARDLGFYDQSHFTRLFTKAEGKSPTWFRRTKRG